MSGWKLRQKQRGTNHDLEPYTLVSSPRSRSKIMKPNDEEYRELYDINYMECYTRDKEYERHRHKMTKRIKLCKYYNPYFCSGCVYDNKCPFNHLSETEFLRYCRSTQHYSVNAAASNDFQEALGFIERNIIKKAFCILKELTSQYSLNGVFNFWFARVYHLFPKASNEDMNMAQFYYRKAISISPNNASFHRYYAQFSADWAKRLKLKVRCSEYKQAKDHFRKSLKIRQTPIVHFMFAKFLDEVENEYIDAQYHYEQALCVLTDDVRLRLNYARCLHKMKEYQLSKKQYEIIFNISSHHKRERHNSLLWPHFHFGKLLKEMQFYEQAKQQFAVCCEVMDSYDNRYYSEIYYEYAQLLCLNLHDCHNALYFINIAIEISPQRRYYKKLLYQILARMKQNQDEAEEERSIPASNVHKQGFNFGYNACYEEDKNSERKEKETENATPTRHTFAFGEFGAHGTDDSEDGFEDHENDNDGAENEFLANRFCVTEFDRFISSDSSFGFEFEKYCDQFEEEQMNDIRVLLNKGKILNEEWLRSKIGMNDASIELWRRSVNMFNDQHTRYISWLEMNGFYNKYFKKFETYGILHLQSFFYHIQNVDDVLYMIGKKNKNDARIIWKSAQKEMDKIMRAMQLESKAQHGQTTMDEHKQQFS